MPGSTYNARSATDRMRYVTIRLAKRTFDDRVLESCGEAGARVN